MDLAVAYLYQTPEGGWRVIGSRVSLDSVVHAFWQGETPETIVQNFPTLTLEQVYGAIASYLHNREEFDQYLTEQQARWEALREESHAKAGPLIQRLRAKRLGTLSKSDQT